MSGKFKNFLSLSSRQKRRRLSSIRDRRNNSEDLFDDSDDSIPSVNEIPRNETSLTDQPNIFADDTGDENNEPVSSDEDTVSSHEELSGEEQDEQQEQYEQDEQQEQYEQEEQDEQQEQYEQEEQQEQEDQGGTDEDNDSSGSSSSGNENHPLNHIDLKKRALKNAFLAANLNHQQGNIILRTLRSFPFNQFYLPKDSRTVLQTPTVVARRFVQQIAGGEYLHIGFRETLVKKLERIPLDLLPEFIEIDFSTDGAKMNKGMDQFWPHQYRVFNISDKRPIIAGVFKGRHKPLNPFDFFEQFIQETIDVREEGGISIRNRQLPLNIRCFIADAPARAFALNHYGHMSANACSKCKVQGHRCTVPGFHGTMVFVGVRHQPRTDEEYNDLIDEDHHKGRSPLSPLIGLVTEVPYESLHLVWLGNCKKIISAHVDGKFGFQRLNGRKIDIINSRMILLSTYCPSEFNRRPRQISVYHLFKGTEFRQLLLYTAPAVLQNVILEEYYDHLMILHCVMRLLVEEDTSEAMLEFCQEALESYVNTCEVLYGEQFMSYNVHGLLHIVDDVRKLGPLETFSAFCYENNMPQLRKYIRKPHLTLEQYYKRVCELNNSNLTPCDNNIAIRVSQGHAGGPLSDDIPADASRQFQKLKIGKITFSTALRDSCCILKNRAVCIIKNIVQVDGDTLLIVQRFLRATSIYNVGITSDDVGIYHCTDLTNRIEAVNLNDVKSKCYKMPKWSDVEGEEERTIEREWICVALLTPLVLHPN